MSNLKYNKKVFTNVKKWDSEGSYLGVLVSGKLNQYNGQGYPIIDAIDIDWNNAYVKNLNCYLNTTEDLIDCLNLSYANFSNYTALSYLNKVIIDLGKQIKNGDNNGIAYTGARIAYVVNLINNINETIDIIKDRNVVIDKDNYYKVEYDDIIENRRLKFADRKYYIYNDSTKEYERVDTFYIVNHPNNNYYMNIIDNVIKDMDELKEINDFIGYSDFDTETNQYTYTGLLDRLHNYDLTFSYIQEEVNEATNTANTAYNISYLAYSYIDGLRRQVIINTNTIGYHTTYNVYKPISELSLSELREYLYANDNNIYTLEDGNYVITAYNPLYQGDYYARFNVIYGTGIEREIELLADKVHDNSYLLYKLDAKTEDPEYIDLHITPDKPGSQERTIVTSLVKSNINRETGEATKGLITNSGLTDSFAYVFDWEILK